MFARAYHRLSTFLAERFALDRPDSIALAEDLLDRTVLPRLFRTLLNLDPVLADRPEESALPDHVDLTAIRRLQPMPPRWSHRQNG